MSKYRPRTPRAQLSAAVAVFALFAILLDRFPPQRYPVYPFCPVHRWLGLDCPGCGITRAVVDLMRGNFAGAASHNVLVFAVVPIVAALVVRQCYFVCRWNRWSPLTVSRAWLTAAYAVVAIFTVVRNFSPVIWMAR